MERTFEEEVLERLARIESSQQNRVELCGLHKADLATLRREIEGNGKPGLKADVISIKESLLTIRTKIGVYSGIGVFVGGTIVSLIAAWIKSRG